MTRWKFDIRAEAGGNVTLSITDTVGEGQQTCGTVAEALSRHKSASRIEVRINSSGGLVDHGVKIYEMLREHRARVHVHVDGIAASIASVIAMAGDEITMGADSRMMIHDPTAHFLVEDGETAKLPAGELRRIADELDQARDRIVAIYASRTGQSRTAVAAAMAAETWMTAEQAMRLGYATAVAQPAQIAASAIDLSRFRRVPSEAYAIAARARNAPTQTEMGPLETQARMTVERQIELMRGMRPPRSAVDRGIDQYLASRGRSSAPPTTHEEPPAEQPSIASQVAAGVRPFFAAVAPTMSGSATPHSDAVERGITQYLARRTLGAAHVHDDHTIAVPRRE